MMSVTLERAAFVECVVELSVECGSRGDIKFYPVVE